MCFTSEISVFQNRDYDDGGYRADLTFRYKGETLSWSVPTDVGDTLGVDLDRAGKAVTARQIPHHRDRWTSK